jgi:hypothetical protein
VAGTRTNAHGIDLNRNYPVPDGSMGDDHTWVEEIETQDQKSFGFAHHFVISENGHSGSLVVNYPWDYTYTLAPDNDALIQLSLEYSTYNLPMYNGAFPQGITNGAAWYVVHGSLQDWSYQETGGIDVTIELSNSYAPPASQLELYWDQNRESFMHFIKAARYGVNGIVTAADTGLPLDATVVVTGIDKPVRTDPDHGDYYKLLDTGAYDITFSANGYITETHYGVTTTWGTPTVLNVDLDPIVHGDVAGHVRDQQGNGLDADIEIRTYPTNSYVTTIQSDAGNDGAYTVNLTYGDYLFSVSSPGHLDDSEVVALNAPLVTRDFVLGIAVQVMLFADDFEDGTGQWSGGWGLASPPDGYDSANSMTDSPGSGVQYPNYANNPCAMISGVDMNGAVHGTLSFWAKWAIELNWDCCLLEVSVDGGNVWEAVATEYTQPASGQGAQVPGGIPVFEGTQANWVYNSVDLAPWLDESDLRFRFRLASDSSIHEDGFYFDDFQLEIVREGSTGVDPIPEPLSRLNAYPNPFNPQTTLAFSVARTGAFQLDIYDLQGHLVRRLLHDVLEAGDRSIVWDGRTDDGTNAASGSYVARLTEGQGKQVVKLTLVR